MKNLLLNLATWAVVAVEYVVLLVVIVLVLRAMVAIACLFRPPLPGFVFVLLLGLLFYALNRDRVY